MMISVIEPKENFYANKIQSNFRYFGSVRHINETFLLESK